MPVDWVGLLAEPRCKLQSFWCSHLREHRKDQLLQSLPVDDRVDFRSFGGPGAGGFLEPPVPFEDEAVKLMPDLHFLVMLRDRLRLPVCPEGAVCQHRKESGEICGQVLDPRGQHAKKCECGGSRMARHDALRNFTASFHPKVTGFVANTEQRVTAWDRVNPRRSLRRPALTWLPGMRSAAALSLSMLM